MNTKYIVTFLYASGKKENENEEVNKMVRQLEGVKSVTSNKYIKSIVDIEYDPQSISGSAIVSQIKQQGAQVALIAM